MLDIETLGTSPGSVIRTIGAVRFDDQGVINTFYEKIDVNSCIEAGLKLQWETLQWWMGQSPEALKDIIAKDGVHINVALLRFTDWYTERKILDDGSVVVNTSSELWGNGATFDNVLIEETYRKTQLPIPWAFNVHRCYRTMRLLHPNIPFVRKGVHHNAVDDAISQAEHLIKIQKLYK